MSGFDWKRVGEISRKRLVQFNKLTEEELDKAEKYISERACIEFNLHIERASKKYENTGTTDDR